MKLLFVIKNNTPHESGGGYYAIFKFAEFLAQRGHEICIYAVHDLGWVENDERIRQVFRPSITRRNRVLRKLDKYVEVASDRIILNRLVDEFKPDWVLGVLRESAITATALAKRHALPIANFIYECPAWLEDVGGDRFRRDYVGYFRRVWEETRDAYLQSDILFPNSKLAGKYCSEWLDGKPIADPVYPGIDTHEMDRAAAADDLPEADGHILYIGRLSELKNVDDLINAVRECKSHPHLHICGDGEDRDKLRQLAADMDNVTFHGFVSDKRLWSITKACDVIGYPTAFEGFGMPPMQGFYLEKPCIASDIPILRSIYGDAIDYVPLGDVPALAANIDKLLARPDYCRERGRAGKEYVAERFTWELAAERIETDLQEFRMKRPSPAEVLTV